ncbi:MAG: 2-oxoacid:acceptor oxidoreductase family protein [Eubacteriaceae bacterium]|jgi:2-oxoacid:acceptor oxidoreductase gamma subunit (pyruvate/2-ketoisovalerate family)|nr:2-oxoacid:acceptor oxidoreductase family protein [Eubacteriaceae bacterium]
MAMKEIRLHGRGGQGAVKAAQLVVRAAVTGGKQAQFIPFFGVERKGSPVFGYLRVADEPIRRKTQIYTPDMLLILDDSLVMLPETYAGLKEGGVIIINSTKSAEELNIPQQAGTVAEVDATAIAEKHLGRNIPNTTILGAFGKVSDLVDTETLFSTIEEIFGKENRKCAEEAYEAVTIIRK